MRKSRRLVAVAGALATLALTFQVVGTAGARKVVRIPSKVTLSQLGPQGKVSSPRSFCVNRRSVALKYRDATGTVRVFGSDKADSSGAWSTDGDGTGLHGSPPWKVYAVIKTHRKVVGKTTFICKGDSSPSQTISGN